MIRPLALLLVAALIASPALHAREAFDLQAHRGARGLLPENTIAGFELALDIGVTTLELDIAITRDRVPVISHDRTLNPDITRDASGRFLAGRGPAIVELSLEQLQAYDVGRIRPDSLYAGRFPEQRPVDGARIPTFDALAEAVARRPAAHVRFAIETKLDPNRPAETVGPDEFARIVVAAIRRHGLASRASVLSFDWRTLQAVQREAPEIETVYLTVQRPDGGNVRPGSPWTAGFDPVRHGSVPRTIRAAGGRTWSSHHEDLTPDSVREARALGLKVLAWTVNDPARMGRLIDMGVDGIVTDRPDLLRAEMAKRGMALPPPARH
ncbi:MAG TPA: glycerophosphodiester phosphodiesterase [Burkholderiaceae bacterium]|nr:glycerophosphodiester phosphodiesterase [Burkholderiaceae bacterium]